MKTVFVPTSPAPFGGSLRWLDTLCQFLPKRGWRVILGVPNESRWDRSAFVAMRQQVDVIELNASTRTSEGRRRSIRNAIRQVKPDVVVPHLLVDAIPAAAAMKREMDSLRLVVRCQEVYPPMLADTIAWSPMIDAVVVVSRLLEKIVATMTDLPGDRILQAPGGVKPALARSPNGTRREEGTIRIGYAGRLDDDKRVMDLVPFCEALDSGGVSYRLDIVGGGSREPELRNALAGQIADGKVRMAGFRNQEELYSEFYPNWEMFILFSPAEGVPVAVLEALTHGVVPVVSDFRGRQSEALLRHGETGLVFPVGGAGTAASLVAELSQKKEWLRSLGEKGRQEVDGRYTEELVVSSWAELLDFITTRPSRSGETPAAPPASGRLDRWLGVARGDTVRTMLQPRETRQPWPMATNADIRLTARVEEVIGNIEQPEAAVDSSCPVIVVP